MTYDLVDSTGNTGWRIYNLACYKYQHYARGIWIIDAPVWNGEEDRWDILHVNPLTGMYAIRSWDNFFGTLPDGGFRFRKV